MVKKIKYVKRQKHYTVYGKLHDHAWYSKIDSYLQHQGLQRNDVNYNMCYHIEKKKILILILYVDDLLITWNHDSKTQWLITQLEGTFEMSNLGSLPLYLNVEFINIGINIFMCQHTYAQESLEEFGFHNYNVVVTPLLEGFKINK